MPLPLIIPQVPIYAASTHTFGAIASIALIANSLLSGCFSIASCRIAQAYDQWTTRCFSLITNHYLAHPSAKKRKVPFFIASNGTMARSLCGHLARPKLPVSRVAQAGHDIRLLVQPFVQRRQMDRNIRMRGLQAVDAFRCGDKADELNLGRAPRL